MRTIRRIAPLPAGLALALHVAAALGCATTDPRRWRIERRALTTGWR
jgi:hypothetical protein